MAKGGWRGKLEDVVSCHNRAGRLLWVVVRAARDLFVTDECQAHVQMLIGTKLLCFVVLIMRALTMTQCRVVARAGKCWLHEEYLALSDESPLRSPAGLASPLCYPLAVCVSPCDPDRKRLISNSAPKILLAEGKARRY